MLFNSNRLVAGCGGHKSSTKLAEKNYRVFALNAVISKNTLQVYGVMAIKMQILKRYVTAQRIDSNS